MGLQVQSETPIDVYELKEILTKIRKRDKELNFRAAKTEEHLQQIAAAKNVDKLVEKLKKLDIPRLRENHIHKIVDILPETVKDLKIVLQGFTVTINAEQQKKIVETIVKHK